jgi:hypothetical protein
MLDAAAQAGATDAKPLPPDARLIGFRPPGP